MRYTFVGDLHGDDALRGLMSANSIQVGDLDLYGYDKWIFPSDGPRYFVEGNHDAFPRLNVNRQLLAEVVPNLYHIPRGYVCGRVLFVGGANSIDKAQRTPGHSWFPEESLSYLQFQQIQSIDAKISVVVGHDAPGFLFNFGDVYGNHRQLLGEIFYKFRPSLWIFGHHHQSIDRTLFDCRFVGLNIAECRTFDIPCDLSTAPVEGKIITDLKGHHHG